jgi:hypothetical protein
MLAVMAAVWLSLGVQPCAIAAAGDAECPHRAHEGTAPAAHHGHAPAQDDARCDVAEPPCCAADAVTVDGRPGAGKGDNGDDVDGQPPTPDCRLLFDVDRPPDKLSCTTVPPPPARPLHVLNCVYLD